MARFSGIVGYGLATETPPGSGKMVDVVTEKTYKGDLVRTGKSQGSTNNINEDVILGNSISVVADAFAMENFINIKYVKWAGVVWAVSSVTVQAPRLILNLGGVYNGKTG